MRRADETFWLGYGHYLTERLGFVNHPRRGLAAQARGTVTDAQAQDRTHPDAGGWACSRVVLQEGPDW